MSIHPRDLAVYDDDDDNCKGSVSSLHSMTFSTVHHFLNARFEMSRRVYIYVCRALPTAGIAACRTFAVGEPIIGPAILLSFLHETLVLAFPSRSVLVFCDEASALRSNFTNFVSMIASPPSNMKHPFLIFWKPFCRRADAGAWYRNYLHVRTSTRLVRLTKAAM